MRIAIKSRPAHGLTISLLAAFAAAVLGCSGVSAEQTAAPSSSDPVPTPTITAEITAPVVTAQLTSQPSTATPTVLAATATVESAGATANPTQDTATIQPPAPTATPTATSTPDQPRPAPTATPATTATPTPTPPPTPTPIPGFARQTQFVPLDNPVFVSAEQAPARVTDESFVLGIEWKGEARAYPLDMMWWHHIVNDTIGGDPVLVTY